MQPVELSDRSLVKPECSHTSDTEEALCLSRDASLQANNTYPIAELDNDARVWERARWHKGGWIERLLTGLLRD